MSSNHPARWWHKLDDGRIQCDLCPRDCKLHEGQRGLCFVRMVEGDRMVLTTYGRSSGFCIDPIEKKPLNHFYPGSSIFSFGTAGCNLTCKFCQNWDISKAKDMDLLMDQASPEAIAAAAKKHDCKSVAFTYNDPVVFAEYAMDTADACHARGIKTVAVTAGYMHDQARREFYAKMDAANVDLKGFTDGFYGKLCSGHLRPVLDTLIYLRRETNVWLEITTLLIPDHNDTDEELTAMSRWIFNELGADVPLHFSAFHPDYKMIDVPPTPSATLSRARSIAMKEGLHYVYTGNVHDPRGDTTYCPSCKTPLIERDWYQINTYHLTDDGHCPKCGTTIAGCFEKIHRGIRATAHPGDHEQFPAVTMISELTCIPDGRVMLEGMLEIPEGAPGIVLFAHGSGSSRLSPRNNHVARVLRDAGLGTLLIDLLTQQEDADYAVRFNIPLLTQRLLAATRWLQSDERTKALAIGYFGASTGQPQPCRRRLKTQPLLRPFLVAAALTWQGRSPEEGGMPVLLIVGGFDEMVIDLNREAYRFLRCEKALAIVPGATHLFEEPGTLELAAKHAASWFGKFMPRPAEPR